MYFLLTLAIKRFDALPLLNQQRNVQQVPETRVSTWARWPFPKLCITDDSQYCDVVKLCGLPHMRLDFSDYLLR